MIVWVVYKNPKDFPFGSYVARCWNGTRATSEIIVTESYDLIYRELSRRGLARFERMPGDDPVVLETWV